MTKKSRITVDQFSRHGQTMDEIKGKCIWITGAVSPLGRTLAETLSGRGNFVIISADDGIELESLARHSGGMIVALPVGSLSEPLPSEDVRRRLSEITDYLDLVICCAHVREPEDELRFDPAMYRRMFDLNVVSVVRTLNLALPLLKCSPSRTQFAVVGSLLGLVGLPRAEGFGASMAALDYFMSSLRSDARWLPVDLSLIRLGTVPDQSEYEGRDPVRLPAPVSLEEAVSVIIKTLCQRKFIVDYPRKLSWALRGLAWVFPVWCRWGSPHLSRLKKQCWNHRVG